MEREPFDAHEFERLTGEVGWVHAVLAHIRLGSTNDEARRLAGEGAREGTVVVADEQTAGRGRLDRRWSAEPGTALLASWILRPHVARDRVPLFSLAAGVAAAAGVEATTGIRADLKWPNDLLCDGRKLAGILCEAAGDAVVVGLGLNVRSSSFPEGIVATSLLLERSPPVGRARLLGAVLAAFSALRADPAACLDEYRARCVTIGRTVRVRRAGGDVVAGVARGIGDLGELLVDEHALTAGDVEHVR